MRLQLLFTLIVGLAISGHGQSGWIVGTVFDLHGASLPDAKITFKGEDGKIHQVSSRDDGKYRIELPEGLYEVTFERSPFTTFRVNDYWLFEKSAMQLDVSMRCIGCEVIEDFMGGPTELIPTTKQSISDKISLRPLAPEPGQNKPKGKSRKNK